MVPCWDSRPLGLHNYIYDTGVSEKTPKKNQITKCTAGLSLMISTRASCPYRCVTGFSVTTQTVHTLRSTFFFFFLIF